MQSNKRLNGFALARVRVVLGGWISMEIQQTV